MNRLYCKLILVLIVILVGGRLTAKAETVDIHGFISQGYLKTNQNNYLAETDTGSFQFNEMGINFTTFVSNDLKMGCQLFARDLGDVGNDEIIINWAFAEYTFRNWLNLRAGILKAPFGFYNDLRDFDSLRTPIFLPSSVYDEWLRDGVDKIKGLELFGSFDLGMLGRLNYQIQNGISPVALDSSTAKFITQVGPQRLDTLSVIDPDATFDTRLTWRTPLYGLQIGGTYARSGVYYEGAISDMPITLHVKKVELYVLSAEYTYQNLKIIAENYWNIAEVTATLYAQGAALLPINRDTKEKKPYYISVEYQMTEWFAASFYHSESVGTDDTLGRVNQLKDRCLSVRFDINPNWIAKLEAHAMEGQYGVSPDNDGHTYNEWMLYAAKLSYSF